MSHSKTPSDQYEVHFDLSGSGAPLGNDLCTTEIYSPSGAVMTTQQGNFSLQLPKGIYRARVRGCGQVKDSLFVVEESGQSRVKLERPQRFSSAPIENVGGSHEYYRESFLRRSVTRAPLDTGGSTDPYLFIFIRMKDEASAANQSGMGEPGAPVHLFAGLSLLDTEGRLLCRFEADEVMQDNTHGFARFRAAIAPGHYRLVYTAADGRSEWMPVHVLAKSRFAWDTDISLIWWQGRPQLSTVSLFTPVSDTAEQRDAHYYEEQVRDIDAVIQTLSSGARTGSVSSSLVRGLLNDKFSNPMLGILGLHMVLLGKHADKSNINKIILNLRELAPGSPDVEALHYIAWEKGLIEGPGAWRFNDIPMIKLGAQAMHRALLEEPALFADASAVPNHAEQLFLHIQPGSPWSQTGLVEQPALLGEAMPTAPQPATLLELGEKYLALPLVRNLAESKTVRRFSRTLADLAINRIARTEALEPLSVSSLLRSSNARVPDWLVEVLLQELPNLKTAYENGELREELKKIATRYEILLPTLYKIAMEFFSEVRDDKPLI